MKKFVVYFENWIEATEWEIFDTEEEATDYIDKQDECCELSPEEMFYIVEEER